MGGRPPAFNFMMSWRFCDDRSRYVTRSSHRVKSHYHSYTFKFEKVVSESARYLLKDANYTFNVEEIAYEDHNLMMSWRFCDVLSQFVTRSSHITPIRRRILHNNFY